MNNWYIIYNGKQVGPMSDDELLAYNPTPETLVWRSGMPEWQPIYNIPSLMAKINRNKTVPPIPDIPHTYGTGRSGKDKVAAGLLAIFLGGLGIHYFYLGKTTGGLVCILLTFITCGIWSVISFIQGIIMLTMNQLDFENKYVYNSASFPLF